jgi:UPF0755 protein
MKRLTIFIIILVILGGIGFLLFREGTLPVNRTDTSNKIFVINQGQNVDSIAQSLSKEGLIRSRIVFFMVVKMKGFDKNIQAGTFGLSPSMDVYTIAKELTHGTSDKRVTIIEGLRKEEIGEIFSREFGIPEVEFTNTADEGYLFPDTYDIPTHASAENIIAILTKTFNEKYTAEIAAKAAQQNLTKAQVVTLASIVEKEAKGDDRQQVASILLKRLKNGWPLQADATVQYALGYQKDEKRWWKKFTNLTDLKIDSPYNTYTNEGLPPGPICSPGIASIEAVVNADPSTPYFFYLHDTKGQIHYAKTNEEHERNIHKYLQ